jgi:Hypothetical protein (DUF2513)
MKRDMDMVRELLLRIEAVKLVDSPTVVFSTSDDLMQPGEDRATVLYHMQLLVDAGFATPLTLGISQFGPGIEGLRWKGHDFLDSVRDAEIWRRTKESASKAGGYTVDLLIDIAKGFIKTQIKKHTGMEV